MQTEQFKALNIKCGGCAQTIRDGLLTLPGVDEVDVDIQDGMVTVRGSSPSREQIGAKLTELGYPEA